MSSMVRLLMTSINDANGLNITKIADESTVCQRTWKSNGVSVSKQWGTKKFKRLEITIAERWKQNGQCWQVLDTNLFGTSVKLAFYYNFQDAAWEIPNRNVYNPKEQPLGFGLTSLEDDKWLVQQNERGHKVSFEFVANGSKAVGIPSANSGSVAAPGKLSSSRHLAVQTFRILPNPHIRWFLSSHVSDIRGWNFNIAGVAALYFSANGGRSKISSNAGDSAHHLIASSDAGIVDAFKFITYKTSITPAVINLNDTDHFQGTHEIKIDNRGNETVEYNIVHEAGSTISTEPASDPVVAFPPIPYSSNKGEVAMVKFSATALDVAPVTTEVMTVTFIEPAGIDAKLFSIYGGYINIIGSHDESLRVTYAGLKIWADEWINPFIQTPDFVLIQENDTFKMTIEDTFTIDFDILWPSREFSFDLVEPSWEPIDWPYPFYPRLPSSTWWPSGNFSHGGAIESGEYKILSRALRTYGDYHNISDWQIRVSPRIIVDKDKA
ncbi:peptidase [Colletotrichum lupini]|uniref:Peptidase n=1 Tax=Colletotrichum lupini TaxID=145971 RepID=A0A9Q8SKN1_9PEZI|nr:peptidase [Colletotrichum lupini]UQC79109.1 peptidase [Colletotrichum lupini]